MSVEPLLTGGRGFFTERSIEQLAEDQGIEPLHDPRTLVGGWPADQDIDAFLEEIYLSRCLVFAGEVSRPEKDLQAGLLAHVGV
jgi:hypothetical protein